MEHPPADGGHQQFPMDDPDFEVIPSTVIEKSAEKSAPGRPFTGVGDPRNGRGPLPGAPNAGRPPSAVREAFRKAAGERLGVLTDIADGTKRAPGDRIRAVEVLARYGLGQLREASVEDVKDRLRETLAILREELDVETAHHVIDRLAEVWQR
jgi:hypothetical protein